jgi:hypothetical protein
VDERLTLLRKSLLHGNECLVFLYILQGISRKLKLKYKIIFSANAVFIKT